MSKIVLGELRAGLESIEAVEFGGVLLGRMDADGTRVEAFEPFVIEHQYGPYFTLSAQDRRRFIQQIKKRRRGGLVPVGLFRSHGRRGLYMDQKDFDLFRSLFRHPNSIFLLVKRDAGAGAKGAIFVWEDNDIRRHESYLEFPVERYVAPPVPPVPVRTGVPAWLPPDLIPKEWVRPAAIGLIGVALAMGGYYAGRVVADGGGEPQIARSEPQPTIQASNVESPRVRAPEAPPAEAPRVAVPEPPVPEPPAPEPLVTPAKSAPVSAAMVAPPTPPAAAAPAPGVRPPGNSRDRATALAASRQRKKVVIPAASAIRETSPSIPDPPPVVAAHLSIPAAMPKSLSGSTPRSERVVAFVKPVPRNRQGIRKIPLLRSLAGPENSEGFTPANPVAHPLPSVPDSQIPDRDSSVELLARIDRRGSVSRVKYSDGNHDLSSASASALSHWRFEPARQNGEPVESEMVVRFEFRKP